MRPAAVLLAAAAVAVTHPARAAAPQPFAVEATIALPGVQGRFDHLAYDARRHRLFVAALGNGSVEVVDLPARKVVQHLTGLQEPQGIAYSETLQLLYVACGGDGTLRSYHGADLSPANSVKVGGDADNVRVDERARRVYVGYGGGALAALEADTLRVLATIPLKAHPESFQLSPADDRVFVNLPHARDIWVLSRDRKQALTSWSTLGKRDNYPMALDATGYSAFVVFRQPAEIAEYTTNDGNLQHFNATCGDADDLFVDARRQRLYVICGEGAVDVLAMEGLTRIGRTPTAPGARTGLFVASIDRLLVAARAGQGDAAIWVLKPAD